MAADTISGYIEGLLEAAWSSSKHLMRSTDGARKATLARFLKMMSSARDDAPVPEEHLAA